jgi:nucleoside-diphosphate-sugar epimerase
MRVCVTGASGMIGAALVRRLLAAGAEVQALVRSPDNARTLANAGLRITTGEITDAKAVAEAMRSADVVFHLAAMVNSSARLVDFLETNVLGTERVLEAAAAAGSVRRIVYSSTLAVYGRISGGGRIDESTALDPSPEKRDAYSHSKILAEGSAVAIAERVNLPLTIVRPGIVYGPAHPPPAGLVAFRLARTHFVFGEPSWHIPLIYLENLVDALLMAAEQPASAGLQDFNIVDDDALTLAAYHLARNAFERSRTIFLPSEAVLAGATIFGPLARAITPAASGFSTYQLQRSLQDRYYHTAKVREILHWSPAAPLNVALAASLKSK